MDFKLVKNYYEDVYNREELEAFPYDHNRYLAWLSFVDRVDVENTKSPTRSLDIGCGVGYACSELQKRGYRVYGTDISQKALELAGNRVPEGDFVLPEPSGHLKFEDHYFDLITCLGVLEHIDNPQHIVSESFRVLKKSGKAVFMVPNSRSPYFWFGGTGQILEVPRPNGAWKDLFQSAGFKIERVGKDPGSSRRSDDPVIRRIKLGLNSVLNCFPVGLTYQFIYFLHKP